MSVIITNAKNRICYAAVRSLGSRGIEVYAADSNPSAMTFYSKYAHGHFTYSSPFAHPDEFIKEMVSQAQSRSCKVIIPVYEETYLFAKYRDRIPGDIHMVLPSYDNILTVHNKDRLYDVARNIGVRVPRSYRLSEIDQNPRLIENLIFPVLIKPCQGGGAWGVRKIESVQELRRVLNDYDLPASLPLERFVVQEFITGEVVCCAMLFNKGDFRAVHSYRQIRETPITGGTATYRESIRHEQVIDNLRNLLTHLKWHGLCQADFIVDKQTGVAYLIDVNPRLYGSLLLSIKSGIDFPYLLYQMATQGDVEIYNDFETGIRSRWIFGDIKCFYENLISNKLDMKSIKNFLRREELEYFDELDLHDVKPFVMWIYNHMNCLIKSRLFGHKSQDVLDGNWQ